MRVAKTNWDSLVLEEQERMIQRFQVKMSEWTWPIAFTIQSKFSGYWQAREYNKSAHGPIPLA